MGMHPLKNIFIFIFKVTSFLLPAFVFSQNNILSFEHFGMEEGLSQNEVTCVFQDSKGYLWIGTQAGLNRYDGRKFKIYKNDPLNTNTISSNAINGICEDGNSNLWIATDRGLNVFIRSKGTFETYLPDENALNSINESEVFSVIYDKQGVVWAKTKRFLEKIDIYSNNIRHFEHYFDLFNPISETATYPLFLDAGGNVWVGTNDGLNVFNVDLEQFIRYEHQGLNKNSLSHNEVRSIFKDTEGTMWIGTSNGLNMFNPKRKNFTRFYYNPIMSNKNIVNDIVQDDYGHLWLASESDGLIRFHMKSHKILKYDYSTCVRNCISSNSVNVLFKDYSDILWIGTRSGLNKLDIKKKKINIYRNTPQSEYFFTSNDFTAIVSNDDWLVLGTRSNGVNFLNRKKDSLIPYTKNKQKLIDDYIHCLAISPEKEILVGTNLGLEVYRKEIDRFDNYFKYHPCKNMPYILGKKITSICFDYKSNLWLGTNQGLHKVDANKNELKSYYYEYNNNTSISSNIINCIYEDSKQDLWIGTSKGLCKYDIQNNSFIVYDAQVGSNSGLSDNFIQCIAEDINGVLWIGTRAGLNKYDSSSDSFHYFAEKEGLPDNQIFAIQSKDSVLWISTNKGLASLFVNSNSIRSYSLADGLQGYEFNIGSSALSNKGEIFFGGVNGFNAFFPDSLLDNKTIPKIEITALNVFNDKGRFNYFIGDEIVLPYNNHAFTIEFAALEFTQPQENCYKYKMVGLDDEWINIENMNFASFSNLPSGEYIFHVKGSNNDQIWNEDGASIRIIIATPFWRNTWAYFLYIALLASVIYIIIEYRTNKLRKANRDLREKQQAALEIAKQREELSIKNKNITDSITYAKRIQWAIMPSRSKFYNLVPGSFILYMPKDIVSGDFYWITEIEDRIYIAAVDCTGHGVPGAFMSIIGFDLLRNVTKEKKIKKASAILDTLNVELIKLLSKNIVDGEVKDGMDLSICVFHKSTCMIEFAGAYNPLYIVRDNKIKSIKGNRFPVGLGNVEPHPQFTNHEIQLKKNDRIYLFTDGYADQFGGPNGKKMKYRRFRHLLLSIHKLPYDQQHDYLQQYITTWQGQLEQIDDILVMGMDFDNYFDEKDSE